MHEGRRQTARREDLAVYGKAPSDLPALKPYWGKPAVRNFREDGGNVGIIRSPVRATALPGASGNVAMVEMCTHLAIERARMVTLCAGINRHEVENARVLRARISDPLGPEFCVGHREVHDEA